jgi:hypothetical protein
MNGVFEMIFSAENIRTAVILIAVFLLKADIGKKFAETRLDFTKEINAVREKLTEKINAVREELKGDIAHVREEVREIKTNDIAHLNQGFRALTFVLTQKAVITPEEREHIDKSLE